MRCKTCDYPLWNLKARQCPECGTAFQPSEFEFVLNSVRFCCPHCDQAYYGTGLKGHIVPEEYNCVQCGRHISMNEMVLRPALGVEEQQTQVGIMPWLQRREIGWWKGWFKTIGEGMMRPHRLMRAVPIDGTRDAWWYATATCLLVFSLGAGLPLLVIALLLFSNENSDAVDTLIAAPGSVIGGTLTFLLGILLWGLTTHGVLRLSGGAAHGISRTYQALLYSIGTIAPMAVPCIGPYCGGYFLWIWYAVSAIFMVSDGQRVHGGRATLAVLTFPVIMGILFFGGYTLLVVVALNSGRSAAAVTSVVGETRTMTMELWNYAQNNNGTLPTHAIELVSANAFGTANFVSSSSATAESDVPIADLSLDAIQYLPPNKQKLAVQSAATSLPKNVVAHRVGDFVFTYHGINLNSADPNLWIVIYSPDPDAAFGAALMQSAVGTAGGNTIPLPVGAQSLLAAQNALRAQYNLPPLPDPATVTHSKPAVPAPTGGGDADD